MESDPLQLLVDRAAISDVIIRYATGIDTRNWDLYRSCFCDDVDMDWPNWGLLQVKAEEWVERVRNAVTRLQATQHISTNHAIDVRGDEANATSYMHAQHYNVTPEGGTCSVVGGYYESLLLRTPDGWKIRKCKQTITWASRVGPFSPPVPPPVRG